MDLQEQEAETTNGLIADENSPDRVHLIDQRVDYFRELLLQLDLENGNGSNDEKRKYYEAHIEFLREARQKLVRRILDNGTNSSRSAGIANQHHENAEGKEPESYDHYKSLLKILYGENGQSYQRLAPSQILNGIPSDYPLVSALQQIHAFLETHRKMLEEELQKLADMKEKVAILERKREELTKLNQGFFNRTFNKAKIGALSDEITGLLQWFSCQVSTSDHSALNDEPTAEQIDNRISGYRQYIGQGESQMKDLEKDCIRAAEKFNEYGKRYMEYFAKLKENDRQAVLSDPFSAKIHKMIKNGTPDIGRNVPVMV